MVRFGALGHLQQQPNKSCEFRGGAARHLGLLQPNGTAPVATNQMCPCQGDAPNVVFHHDHISGLGQPINMAHLFAAPLGWKARGFIQNDQMIVHVYHRILIIWRSWSKCEIAWAALLYVRGQEWGNAHLLPASTRVAGLQRAPSIRKLAFATHLFDANLAGGKQPLEPTVQTLIRVLRRNRDTLNTAHDKTPLAKNTPMKSATIAPITETAT